LQLRVNETRPQEQACADDRIGWHSKEAKPSGTTDHPLIQHAPQIGTGLFVGSGQTLARGGPAFILISYIFMAFLVWCIVTSITEVAAWLPTKGSSMNMFGYRYVSRSLGFAMGWLYWYSLGILVPYEITAAGLVIDFWNTPVNIAVWIRYGSQSTSLLCTSAV